jgi:hypothetical protein
MKTVYFDQKPLDGRKWTDAEIRFVLAILNHPRAWPVGPWARAARPEASEWHIKLEPQRVIDATVAEETGGPAGRTLGGLSVTYMSVWPRMTQFSLENWTAMPPVVRQDFEAFCDSDAFFRREPQMAYRCYLVLHECGHALGLGHRKAKAGTITAPVMQQQSRPLHGLRPNPWPLDYEIQDMAKKTV